MTLCANCGLVEMDSDDNTITFIKNGEKTTGKVCPNCFYDLEEVEP